MIEDEWNKARGKLARLEYDMNKEAKRLARKIGISEFAIGMNPDEWYYFIKGIRENKRRQS